MEEAPGPRVVAAEIARGDSSPAPSGAASASPKTRMDLPPGQTPGVEVPKIKWKDRARGGGRPLPPLPPPPDSPAASAAISAGARRRSRGPRKDPNSMRAQIPTSAPSHIVPSNSGPSPSSSSLDAGEGALQPHCRQSAPSVAAIVSESETLNSRHFVGNGVPQQPMHAHITTGSSNQPHPNGFGAEFPIAGVVAAEPGLSSADWGLQDISGSPSCPSRYQHSSGRSGGTKRSLPSEFATPPVLRLKAQNMRQDPSNLAIAMLAGSQSHRSGQPFTDQSLPISNSAGNFGPMTSSANQLELHPVSFPWPEHIPSGNGDPPLPRLQQVKSREVADLVQRKIPDKRKLRQLQNQVQQKFKLWAHEAGLIQGLDGGELGKTGEGRVIISEEKRDAFVKGMVESCRISKHLRETFLGAVQASTEILHASALSLLSQNRCDAAQEVVDAWTKMSRQPRGDSPTRLTFYKAVETLHTQGDGITEKFHRPEVGSVCSFGKNSVGAWEVIIPGLNTQKVSRRKEK